ncbi:MAG: acyl carrier protein [Myxococcales bacterium]|jgi:acyl carrier protein|nr:acyl carrier protein [Myxococcales bacterium]MBK7194060.1 acyl carrier protein [Myxococcales bacterium]MBP6843652.1 acyl carrier protein [Kofleriaceae bacterium]
MSALDAATVERAVTTFIVDNFLFGNAADAPARDASFMETGLIDSTGVLELVAFVESTYAIKVGDDELVPENLDSVANLAAFVAKKAG